MAAAKDDPETTEPEAEAKPKRRPRRKAAAADPPAAPATTGADATAARPPAADEEEAPAPDADAEPEATPRSRRPRRARGADEDRPAAPAPRPARPARDHDGAPPMVRAHAKYVRTSARKARLVCDHIRGKSVVEARAILAHANRDVARDWSKLLESAVANAEHNHELVGDELRIHAVKADEGPTLKRFRPRAMGRATKIRKRTSHLSITLTPIDSEL